MSGSAPGRREEPFQKRLAGLGRQVEVDDVDQWPGWPLAHALHAALAVVGSALSVSAPLAGTLLVAAATLLTFLDATGVLLATRRLFGRRTGQIVVSPSRAGRGGVLVLVAHAHGGRGGVAFGSAATRLRAAAGKLLRTEVGLAQPFWWALLMVLSCCLLRVAGVEGTALTIVQFVPTVALIVAVALLIDVALAPAWSSAGDEASNAVLELARRYGDELEQLDLWIVLTSGSQAAAQSMRAFLRRHRDELARDQTLIVGIGQLERGGTLRFTRREGPLLALRSHPRLVRLCAEIAEDAELEQRHGSVSRAASEGYGASAAGYAAITIEADGSERAVGFCGELIRRLDLELGS